MNDSNSKSKMCASLYVSMYFGLNLRNINTFFVLLNFFRLNYITLNIILVESCRAKDSNIHTYTHMYVNTNVTFNLLNFGLIRQFNRRIMKIVKRTCVCTYVDRRDAYWKSVEFRLKICSSCQIQFLSSLCRNCTNNVPNSNQSLSCDTVAYYR